MVSLKATIATSLLLLVISMHLSEAGRMLLDEEEKKSTTKNFGLVESELKGTTPPAGPNPTTNIPSPTPPKGNHVATSTINQRNFACHTTTTSENSIKNKIMVLMESKQRAPVPPGGHNEKTNIPGPVPPRKAALVINQRNFAGFLRMRALTSCSHC